MFCFDVNVDVDVDVDVDVVDNCPQDSHAQKYPSYVTITSWHHGTIEE